MTGPLVSICVPTIGRADMLAETLASIRAQTYPRYEVLILDNACDAPARDVIHSYAGQEPRARVIRSEERLHMFANFSRGVAHARGAYLTFFHDDDIYLPTFIEQHIALLEARERAAFSGSNCAIIDSTGRIVGRRTMVRGDGVWPGRHYIREVLRLGVNVVPMQSIVFRRSVLPLDAFDPRMPASFYDLVILMRLAERHDVGMLAARLLRLRDHEGQASRRLPAGEAVDLRTEILLAYCREFAARWPKGTTLVKEMEHCILHARRTGLVWGWLSSRDDAEATDCLARLRRTDRLIGIALEVASRLGLSLPRRRKYLIPAARRLVYAFATKRSRPDHSGE